MIELLILTEVDEWGKATEIVDSENDPLWKVNPHGTLALYNHRVVRNML